MTTIGVVSDTHLPFRARRLPSGLLTAFKQVDLILHAGDHCVPEVVELLSTLAPVQAVYGNCDPDHFTRQFDARRLVEVEEVRIGLTHGHLGRGISTPERARNVFIDDEVHCVVFGHSHVPLCEERNSVLLFNPGSCTDPRGRPPSFGLLFVKGSRVRGELRWLE